MHIFAGTYQGNVISISGLPTELKIRMSRPYSENSLRSMAISGQQLYVGGYDQQFRAIDSISATQTKQSKDSKGIINIIRVINKNLLILGLDNGIIRFWNKTNWSPRKDIKQHKKSINDIQIDHQGLMMVTVGGKQMIFWNIGNMKSMYHYRYDYDIDQVLLVDGFQSLFLISGRTIRQLKTQDNTQMHKIELTQKIQCGLVFMNFLIIATQKGQIKIWKIGQFNHCIHFKAHQGRTKDMKKASYEQADYLVTADANGNVSCWDILQFIKGVDQISQDYPLEGLQPLASVKTGQRIICIEVSGPDFYKNQQEQGQQNQQKQQQQVQQQQEVKSTQKKKKKKFINKQQQNNKKHK